MAYFDHIDLADCPCCGNPGCIEEEVGIPAEKLIWLEDEEWQERKESES